MNQQRPERPHDFACDELIVNYHDACIYGRDIKLLLSNSAWLNDSCLHYQLVHLYDEQQQQQQEQQQQQQHSTTSSDACTTTATATAATSGHSTPTTTVLLDPTVVSYFMHQCETDDEMIEFRNGYQGFTETKRIFLPINDSLTSSEQRFGQQGTHWSLLVIHMSRCVPQNATATDTDTTEPTIDKPLPESQFSRHNHGSFDLSGFHYDSIPRSRNRLVAQAVATKLRYALLVPSVDAVKSCTTTWMANIPVVPVVVECKAPQQHNGFDCGLHVLATVEVLLLHHDHHTNVVDTRCALSRLDPTESRVAETKDSSSAANGVTAETDDTVRRLAQLFHHRPLYAPELRHSMVRDILRRWQDTHKGSM